jgi:hypothetical protein
MRELDKHLLIANNVAILSPDEPQMRSLAAAITARQPGGFLASPLGAHVAAAYRNGAGWLFCADLELMMRKSVQTSKGEVAASGMNTMRYLVIERKDAGGNKTETAASLSFSGERSGVASWLAAPSKMGALEFISPDATIAVGLTLKNPEAMLDDLLRMAGGRTAEMEQAEAKLGIRFREDVAQALGGDVAFAVDGPLLPTPAWKVIIEVNDAARLEQALNRLLVTARQEAPGASVDIVRDGDFRHVTARTEKGTFELWYTFSNGYLVAGGRKESVTAAVQHRTTGYWLARSPGFQSQLPRDGQANLSAVIYENVGPALRPLLGGLSAVKGISASQRQAIDSLANSNEPAMVYAYGEADRIRVASTANLLGLALDSLMYGNTKQ